MIAANIAPGMNRSFLAEEWTNIIPKKEWYDAIDEANEMVNDDIEVDIQGYDIDGAVVKAARENAREAGVDHMIHFQQRPVSALSHPKKYGFIIPHQMSGGMMPGGNYYNAIFETAQKWGIPVLNLAIEAPPFGRFASTSPLYALTTAYTHNGDGWHPNEQGYKKYYVPKIEAWMKTL
jgi:hypothetical protein